MRGMFEDCSFLREINLTNFKTDIVTNMEFMFFKYLSLKYLNLANFSTNHVINMRRMFLESSEELKMKIGEKYKQFNKDAFE